MAPVWSASAVHGICPKAGHEVTVIDRQSAAGLEQAANGGQISVSHAEPWSNPTRRREHSPGWGARMRRCCSACWDPALFDWSWRFLRECGAHGEDIGTSSPWPFILSRELLKTLREDTGIEYDHLERASCVYTDQKEFAASIEASRSARVRLRSTHGRCGRMRGDQQR